MSELVRIWFRNLYSGEIEEVKSAISNEHLWELGYDGTEPVNPHTENIEVLKEYLAALEEKLEELQ